MHFTREPIIETVITARDGFKLSVRNSKGSAHEEYTVEAIEVVSFGTALFFRSMEKPKAFLLPVTDYEVLETKETRVLLKSVSLEKSIKIGGGREASLRTSKETVVEKEEEPVSSEEETPEGSTTEPRIDKRRDRDRRRHRRRRTSEERHEMKEWMEKKTTDETAPSVVQGGDFKSDETAPTVSSPLFGTLIPPPTTLISESLARYKDALLIESPLSAGKVNEPPKEEPSRTAPQPHHAGEEEEDTTSP